VANFFIDSLHFPDWLGYLAAGLIQCVLLIHVPLVGAMFFVWVERKVSARIQDRLGPTRVGGKFGWLQLIADGLKLLNKEDLMPEAADKLLFRLAPYVSFCASFAALLALPFADGWVAQSMNIAVFFLLAVLGLEVFGVILAGYASASKWSLFGAMREAAQVVSYEVPLGLCVVVPVLIAGTMDLQEIGAVQAGLFTNWFIFHDIGTFFVFWIYFTCATASVNRAPFDLAEAESELVAGFHTEYSGFRWLLFFMAEYGSMFIVSGLGVILFFGGWNGPLPIADWLGLGYESVNAAPTLAGWLGNLLGCVNFIFKTCLGVTVMIWIRWTLPRLRIDQVLKTCLKYCTPLAAVCFLIATLSTLVGATLPNLLAGMNAPRWVANNNYAETLAERYAAVTPRVAEEETDDRTAGNRLVEEEPSGDRTVGLPGKSHSDDSVKPGASAPGTRAAHVLASPAGATPLVAVAINVAPTGLPGCVVDRIPGVDTPGYMMLPVPGFDGAIRAAATTADHDAESPSDNGACSGATAGSRGGAFPQPPASRLPPPASSLQPVAFAAEVH